MASAVPTAKAALKAAIESRDNVVSQGVVVRWGAPTDESQWLGKHEMIYFGRVDQAEEWGSLGGGRRDEDFTIDVVIQVHQLGDDEQETETRAWELRDEIEAALKADKTLGGAVSHWVQIERTTQENEPLEDGWGVRLTVTVRCINSGI